MWEQDHLTPYESALAQSSKLWGLQIAFRLIIVVICIIPKRSSLFPKRSDWAPQRSLDPSVTASPYTGPLKNLFIMACIQVRIQSVGAELVSHPAILSLTTPGVNLLYHNQLYMNLQNKNLIFNIENPRT